MTSRILGTAALLWLAAAGVAEGSELVAYARLLETHVRPGMVNGIQANLVDYAALKTDPDYATALAELAAARPEALASEAARFVFWVNAYNLLAIKAVADRYPTKSIRDGGSWLTSIWKTNVGVAAGRERTLDEIEHEILRKEFREPRVHFAVVCASLSCPDLRREPYTAERLEAQLDEATRGFLANRTKGLLPDVHRRGARVSMIFRWFAADFPGGVPVFLRAHVPTSEARWLESLTSADLSYLDYDWSLNDLARAR